MSSGRSWNRPGGNAVPGKDRLKSLEARLGAVPVDDVIDFQKWLDICEYRSNMLVAYHATFPLGSDDGFLYFRRWLVSLGRETFERVIADPDQLIEVPEVLRLGETRPTT